MLMEHCGIIAVLNKLARDVTHRIYEGLIALQHRGQESAGIAILDGDKISLIKNLGFVTEAIKPSDLNKLKGYAGIGHVRYSTTGESSLKEAQPMIYYISNKDELYFAIAFNGTISNYYLLKKRLVSLGYRFHTNTDTEVLAALVSYYWKLTQDFLEALKKTMSALKGAYSIVILTSNGEIYAMRDPLGFKPLVLGKSKDSIIIASESIAIDSLGGELIRDISPGEILKISDSGNLESYIVSNGNRRAYCMFEYIYFSRPDSVINGISVYDVRLKLGEILAKLYPVEADVIIPVPDTGVIAALGYSRVSGIPISMGLIRNPYVGRTFIKPNQALRELSVQLKMGVVKEIVDGKKIVLIDDSIVRGTTIKWIIKLLRNAGAKEIHTRITCPPIKYPCYMGIDFPMRRELIASKHSVEEIRRLIDADSLGYMTIEGLIEAIGLSRNNLCLACLTGEYLIERAQIPVLEEVFGGVKR